MPLSTGFANYLEPISGFICSQIYKKDELAQAGINLVRMGEGSGGWYSSYQDEKHGTWWTDVTGRYGELVGSEFQFLGRERLEGLQAVR